MLGSWREHSTSQEQIKNIAGHHPQLRKGFGLGADRPRLPQKAANGRLF
jgi:hypothetical protein